MTKRHIIAALLVALFALSVSAEITQQEILHPTAQTKQELTKALLAYREKNDGQGEALTLLRLGMADAGLGDAAGARASFLQAVEKMRARNDFIGAWLGLLTLAQVELTLGRPAEAIPHLEKALSTLNDAKTSTAPFTLETFAAFASTAGLSADVLHMLDERQIELLKIPMIQYSFEPMTHDFYGSALTQVGKLEKAEAELNTANAGSAFSQGMYDFSIQTHFGDLRVRQQRYDEARTHYMKALDSASKITMMGAGTREITAGIYDRLSRLETTTGHPDDAKRWSQKAAELMKKQPGSR